jgi:hypothetical protein
MEHWRIDIYNNMWGSLCSAEECYLEYPHRHISTLCASAQGGQLTGLCMYIHIGRWEAARSGMLDGTSGCTPGCSTSWGGPGGGLHTSTSLSIQ